MLTTTAYCVLCGGCVVAVVGLCYWSGWWWLVCGCVWWLVGGCVVSVVVSAWRVVGLYRVPSVRVLGVSVVKKQVYTGFFVYVLS